MPRHAVRSRFRAWSLRFLLVLLAALLWKLGWRYGPRLAPGPSQGMFPVHARLLLQTTQGYPRPVEASVPAPATGSNAEIQLRLMGWRDAAGWTMKALDHGRVVGKELRIRAGGIAFRSVDRVGPLEAKDGEDRCTVAYRVRWELPDGDREAWQVKGLIDLRPPRLDLAQPGQEAPRSATFAYRRGRWEAVGSPGPPREGSPASDRWAWLAWLL